MKAAAKISVALAVAILAAGPISVSAAAAQAQSKAASNSASVPKGHGSLAGLWVRTGYLGSLRHTARERIARDIDGKIPLMLPWARDLLEQRVKDADEGRYFANNAAQCLPQGVPYMLFGAVEGVVQIFEEQGQVTVITEEGNEIWNIYLDQKHPPREEIEPTYHGDSVAQWQGDTLVIDTLGLNTNTTLDQVGMPHSEAMHVITKARRATADTLEFLVTIDDPKTFSAPWTQRLIYKKAPAGERVREFVCENNRNAAGASGHQSFDGRSFDGR
jgi:hypothetical protein